MLHHVVVRFASKMSKSKQGIAGAMIRPSFLFEVKLGHVAGFTTAVTAQQYFRLVCFWMPTAKTNRHVEVALRTQVLMSLRFLSQGKRCELRGEARVGNGNLNCATPVPYRRRLQHAVASCFPVSGKSVHVSFSGSTAANQSLSTSSRAASQGDAFDQQVTSRLWLSLNPDAWQCTLLYISAVGSFRVLG